MGLFDKIEEGEFCFAFTINSAEFIKTGNFEFCYVGAGPTIVDRRDGTIIPMGNMGTMSNYEKRGNPYNRLTEIIQITGTYGEGLRPNAFKFFRQITDKSVAECLDILDGLCAGEPFVFDAAIWGKQKRLEKVEHLRGFGFDVKRLTLFEAYPEREKELDL